MKIRSSSLVIAQSLAPRSRRRASGGTAVLLAGLVYGWHGVARSERRGPLRRARHGASRRSSPPSGPRRPGRAAAASLRGFYGVPLVAYDGTTGGLSGDGRTLVLALATGRCPASRHDALRSSSTRRRSGSAPIVLARLVVVRRDLARRLDALSRRALSAGDRASLPRRALRHASTRQLLRTPIVDRLDGEEAMRGQPVTRSDDAGRPLGVHALRAREHEPFVHALDTVRRQAYCIDLPLDLRRAGADAATARARRRGRMLAVRQGGERVADASTRRRRQVQRQLGRGRRQRLGRVRDLAGDLDDVAVRVVDAELAVRRSSRGRGSPGCPRARRREPSSRACGASSCERAPDEPRDRNAVAARRSRDPSRAPPARTAPRATCSRS